MTILRFLLWDHLSLDIPTLKNTDKKNDVIVFCETRHECTYIKHHKKKLVFLLSAMRHFAAELTALGYSVCYVKLDDEQNSQTITGEMTRLAEKFSAKSIYITCPGEYRLYAELSNLKENLPAELVIYENDLFLATNTEFHNWAKDKKSLRMEFFYREMRKKYQVLMHDGNPEGGKWNYDAENRHFPKTKINIPKPCQQPIDAITQSVMDLVEINFADHFGELKPFFYAVTRKQALSVLDAFIETRLANFGEFQDVMMQDDPWLFHSHISFYLNVGLLNPLECIKAAELSYYNGLANLAAVEGFIRQILGWREFIRGIYWLKMPSYKNSNYLSAHRHLPNFYWTAKTEMNCMKQCVNDTKVNAYAHHIQRLMVLGNFSLLAGIDPDEVNEWYHIVYADAHEWVELPNVTGMILFADGGYLASKPYAASGAYINKMSNYCKNCVYKVNVKSGEQACPFNYLYWNFLIQNRKLLKSNQRLSMIYSTLLRMSQARINEILADSQKFLASLTHEW